MIWRTQNNVPEIYPSESRDFQLLGRLLDCVVNGVKFNIDAIQYLSSTKDIMSSLLPLLQEKLGFFSTKNFTDEELRYILDAFPTLMKYKGSKKAIEGAINVFLRLYALDTHQKSGYVEFGDESYDISVEKYTIYINLEVTPRDTKVLDEIFKYILPTGYTVEYRFYTEINSQKEDVMSYTDSISIETRLDSNNNLRPAKDEATLTDIQKRTVGTVGMTEIDEEIVGS